MAVLRRALADPALKDVPSRLRPTGFAWLDDHACDVILEYEREATEAGYPEFA
jgi:hypothetical protein